MGKVPLYTDSDETENTDLNSSYENLKNKKKSSILKYTGSTAKKKKCRVHTKSEPEDSDCRSHSQGSTPTRARKLRGILKHNKDRDAELQRERERERERERAFISSEDDDEVLEAPRPHISREKYLVGRVPRPPGSKPGRGGGVALIVRRNERVKPLVIANESAIYAPKPKRRWLLARKQSN